MVPNIGIKYETCDWKIKPLFFKILNRNNQATPVGTSPKYMADIIESVLGIDCQGCSIKLTNGIKIIIAQINIEGERRSFSFNAKITFKK